MSAFICLGKKYDIHKLYKEAVKKLYTEIPATLDDWDALSEHWNLIEPPSGGSEVVLVKLAILARQSGLLSILPYTLYQCCVIYSYAGFKRGWKKFSLPAQDQIACLEGYRNGLDVQADTTYAWLGDHGDLSPSCLIQVACKMAKQRRIVKGFNVRPALVGLDLWEDWMPSGLCDSCKEYGRRKHEAGRAEFWEKLPSLFDLPPWTELMKEREEMYELYHLAPRCTLIVLPTESDISLPS